MKISKPISIIFLLGIFTGYFYITGAYPVGLLCVPVCLVFFRFSKEKLSAHINLFAFASAVFGLILYGRAVLGHFRTLAVYFASIIVLTLLGRMAKKIHPVFIQTLSLIYWGITILAFLVLSTVHTELGDNTVRTMKFLSLFFSGTLGLPPSPLFVPTLSFCHENLPLFISVIIISSLPAIVINLFREMKPANIDIKFVSYYIISLIIGSLLGALAVKLQFSGEFGETFYQLSIIIPSIILYGINIRNTAKTFRQLKKNKTP